MSNKRTYEILDEVYGPKIQTGYVAAIGFLLVLGTLICCIVSVAVGS